MQAYASFPEGLQQFETLPELFSAVGDILHDMRRAPHVSDPERLLERKHLKRVLAVLRTVIDPEENVRMRIDGARKNPGLRQ